jgi:rhamnosyltransferase subunit B
MSKRIVLTTFGSLGDLYPYIAIALELQTRGYEAVIATSESFRAKVESEGIKFYPVRPDSLPWQQDREWMKLLMDSGRGIEYLINYLLMPHLRASYSDIMEATEGADLLVTHPLSFAGSLVAEKRGIPRVSSVLSPSSFQSVYESSGVSSSAYERGMEWVTKDGYQRQMRWLTRFWSAPVRQLRRELGLPSSYDPLCEGQHSPDLVLALFSPVLGTPQPDWPPQTHQTGFAFYDSPKPTRGKDKVSEGLSPQLMRFLEDGPAPIVFTLGSSAVLAPGNFYWEGAQAAHQLGYRSVLLMGAQADRVPSNLLPPGAIALNYAPHSLIFPHSAVIVHHGGVGTTGQALLSGRPMLIVPHSYEQPDNAARVVRLGVARQCDKENFNTSVVVRELEELLVKPSYAGNAIEVSHIVQKEDGTRKASDLIEVFL